MIVIRLAKGGRKLRPHFSLVAIDSRESRNSGNFLQKLGFYDPKAATELSAINIESIKEWLSKGAQMSDTVRSLLKKAGHKL